LWKRKTFQRAQNLRQVLNVSQVNSLIINYLCFDWSFINSYLTFKKGIMFKKILSPSKIGCVSLFLWMSPMSWGQDYYFSNAAANKALLNPSWVGDLNLSMPMTQVGVQYRRQAGENFGANQYETMAATFQWSHPVRYVNHWGLGGQFCRDNVESGFFKRTQMEISGFYSQFLWKSDAGRSLRRTYASIGMSGGVSQGQLGALRWVSEYETGTYTKLPELHQFPNELVMRVHTGVMIQSYNEERNGWDLGLSAFQLNRPKLQGMSDSSRVSVRWAIHGSYSIPLGRWQPKIQAVYLRQGDVSQQILGIWLPFDLKHQVGIAGNYRLIRGNWGGNVNTLNLMLKCEFSSVDFYVSYDANVGTLNLQNRYQNAFELGTLIKIYKKN
jgi:hypothetical protein